MRYDDVMPLDLMRFALVDPKNCPFCQRKADQIEASMRDTSRTEAIMLARSLARCEGHAGAS